MSSDPVKSNSITRRAATLGLASLASCRVQSDAGAQGAPLSLHRGIGVHNLMNWPRLEAGSQHRFVWPPYNEPDFWVSDAEMANIRRVGFDFVRLTIGPEIFMATHGPRSRELSEILKRNVQRFRAADLNVVVDLHPTWNSDAYSAETIVNQTNLFRRYTDVVRQIANDVREIGGGVALELINEPLVSSAARWREMTLVLARAAREEAPHTPLIISGYNGGGYEELLALDPLPSNLGPLIYTFHYYGPSFFTHQTQIDSSRHVSGLEWPPQRSQLAQNTQRAQARIMADRELRDDARLRAKTETAEALQRYYERGHGPAMVTQAFEQVAAWADQHGVARNAIFLGEFGVVRTHWQYQGADEASRVRWVETVRGEAEEIAEEEPKDDAALRALGLSAN